MIYYIVYFLTKVVSWFYFPFTAFQTQKIPRQGAFILASNHISNLDPVLLGISSVRRLNFMAKIELFKGVLGFILTRLGSFPVKRGEADFGAMREALKRLKMGRVILIFVEGTRRIGNAPSKAQAGVGFLAMKSGVPIVPVYVKGTDKVMAPGTKSLKRGRVFAIFGEPFYVKDAPSYEEASQRILDKIYALA
ncbi:MAG: 1-acyl-sn-glycerol-3-phosphate acyltransferase [Candidatus Omnitrophica bacterium]|nr:1-acyl-sn-glycerol-3-phosphate acyltransferase [Candidatus Omnitrophota bacterium]MDE2008540.1 1-acyl-sn-glycerol-3-phosphate acyltransferase [Candidatus Omnitrophota bacterium]